MIARVVGMLVGVCMTLAVGVPAAPAGTASSDPLDILVTPTIQAGLSNVLLFGKARVTGKVEPEHEGEKVDVRLLRNGKQVGKRQATLNADGRFRTRFYIRKPGRYRAVATFDDADHETARDRTRARATPLPRLREGSKRTQVLLLERRLRQLNHYITGIDRRFDKRTGDAVMAFHKVQGMNRVKSVSAATWRRLAGPRTPRPKFRRPRHHIEIDQRKQVLYVVDRGKISWILHTSTGRNGWTRDGKWRVHRKLAGYSPNRLWYPSYFDGNRAVHGWPQVPSYPASHGCSRVPMWTATWMYKRMPVGTVVRVYH